MTGSESSMELKIRYLDEGFVEIEPQGISPLRVLEQIAIISYETADCPLHHFIMPFEIDPQLSDITGFVRNGSIQMDYVNGRLCSTYAYISGKKILFDGRRFERDRGSTKAFLTLLSYRIKTEKTPDG